VRSEDMARTLSAEAHEKALEATVQLIADRGIDATRVDAIAHISGVSKATLYKHWKNRDELLLAAIGRLGKEYPVFNSGDTRADLIAFLGYLAHKKRSERAGRIWPRIIAHSCMNSEFARVLRQRFTAPARERMMELLRRGIAKGDLPSNLDLDFARDLLIGPIMHRRIHGSKIPPDLPERVVDVFWSYGRASAKAKAPGNHYSASR
jgi:AcrR family transcriptional regulator